MRVNIVKKPVVQKVAKLTEAQEKFLRECNSSLGKVVSYDKVVPRTLAQFDMINRKALGPNSYHCTLTDKGYAWIRAKDAQDGRTQF